MKAAIIGLGVIGRLHAELAQAHAELVAVCDADEKKLAPYGNAKKYADYVRMLDEVKPDVVHICTPHYLHAEMAIAALRRGCNVLLEKPLCVSEAEIAALRAAERESNAQLGVCLQNRYLAVNRFAKDFLRETPPISATGYLAWHRDEAYYGSAAWRGKKATEGGGVLINQALHTLDLLQWFCGEPSSLRASISTLALAEKIEVEDTATLVCDGKVPFTFFATNGSATDFPVQIGVQTATGVLRITPECVCLGEKTIFSEASARYHVKPSYGYGHELLIEDFYRCVQSGEPFPITVAEATKALRLVLAAYESGGNRVRL